MVDPITRPAAISEEDVNRLAKILERRGGTMTIQDPRINQVQNWLIGLVGAGMISAMLWLANSVDNLNKNFAGMSVWKDYTEHRVADNEKRIRDLEQHR